jgi:hypothetical protein
MKKWRLILLCAAAWMGCEKTINIQPDQQTPKLVVEAQIENNLAPVVALSTSLNYFSTIDYVTLNNSYVHGAKVTITESGKNYALTEDSMVVDTVYKLYYYTISPFLLAGGFGKQYDLRIETGGQVYTSTTTIPNLTKKIDSLWWKPAPNNPDTNKAVLMARITDPPGYGNYIRYFTKTNRDDFLPGLNSVFDDQIIDGKTYDIQVDAGVNKNEKLSLDTYGYFKRGDTVTVKFCDIDKASFDFWRTWEFSFQSTGNPFSSPGKVLGNISNGALGSFCGYSAQYIGLIIPK